jgi:hypothetical protein
MSNTSDDHKSEPGSFRAKVLSRRRLLMPMSGLFLTALENSQ